MKYNITINQAALAETSLDLLDAAILDYLYIYCNSLNEKIEGQRIRDEAGAWTWVDYGTILKDLPLLRIKSTGALTPRVRRIEAEGFISTRREDNQKLFIKLNSKVDELFIKLNRAAHETKQSYSRNSTNTNTRDSSTKSISAAKAAGAKKLNPLDNPEPCSLPQFVAWCRKSDQRHIRLIGEYADERKIQYATKGQWASFIRRNLRAARSLSPYTDGQLDEAMRKIDGAKKDYLKKWTLETLAKYLDDN